MIIVLLLVIVAILLFGAAIFLGVLSSLAIATIGFGAAALSHPLQTAIVVGAVILVGAAQVYFSTRVPAENRPPATDSLSANFPKIQAAHERRHSLSKRALTEARDLAYRYRYSAKGKEIHLIIAGLTREIDAR